MHRRIARAFVNLGCKEDDLPILLESVEGNDDEQNHTETEDDPRISQEDLERIKPSKQRSSYRLLWLAIITCLILTVSLLVGLLIISEKVGRRCGCSEQNGAQHHKNQLTKKDFLGENETSISDLLEYLSSTMIKVEAAVDETKNDIAKLNRTTSTVENLNSSMNEVKAAVDGTKNDIAKLNKTTTTVENLNSSMNEVKAAVDGAKNDIAKLNRTTTTVENLNSAMNEVKAAVDGTKNDIAKLNRTTTMVENFNSAMNEVKAAVDGTKNDIAKLNRTTTMVENLNSAMNEVKAAVDGTKNDIAKLNRTTTMVRPTLDRTSKDITDLKSRVTKLDKAIQSNLSESCQNVTWNSAFEDCKLKCCCSASFCEETPPAAESCKKLYNTTGYDVNKAYPLKLGKKILPVYCHMTALNGCGGGGWTLVMKMDGLKDTFHYNQLIWTNMLAYNPSAGSTGFDGNETMLPTYWETKFNRICLGMKSGKEINFIAINRPASSLYSLIVDGKYRPTSLGRDKWKSLLPSNASLQPNCNREGFNALCTGSGDLQPRARIGILSNEQNDCNSCDSRIGFGTGGKPDYSNSCGNVAVHQWGADNGDKNIKTMGYILVQ